MVWNLNKLRLLYLTDPMRWAGMLAMQITYAKHGMRHHMTELPAQNQMFMAKVRNTLSYSSRREQMHIEVMWVKLQRSARPLIQHCQC